MKMGYAFGLLSLTPSPFSPAAKNSIPAFASAFSIAVTVLTRELTFPFSKRVTAFSDTMALSASCCWDQPKRARAARICRGVIMTTTIDTETIARHQEALYKPYKVIE